MRMATPPSAHVGATVKAEMARTGVTQHQLAAKLGVTQSSVSARLRGRVKWTVEEILTVSEFLGVPPTHLMPAQTEPAA